MKPKTKKFVGYVPKGEVIKKTLDSFGDSYSEDQQKTFGMYGNKKDALSDFRSIVKRTITLTWIDEEVKEKK